MNGEKISREYLRKSKSRLKAVRVLFEDGSYDDVVRECQEIVELVLKGMLRKVGIDPPRIHDVGQGLKQFKGRLPEDWKRDLDGIVALSKELFEERSRAFYGDEGDFIPFLDVYGAETAENFMNRVEHLVHLFEKAI